MTSFRLFATKYANHTSLRFLYILLSLLALALAGGAPDDYGGH